jgi:vancomycin permeability regulator SanA
MNQSKNTGLIVIIGVLLLLIIIQYFTLNKNSSNNFNNQTTILHQQNDSLLLSISKNESQIHKMDSLIHIYESRVDSSKNKLADLQIIADQNKQKYNEEHNRLINLSNKSVVGEFTNAFKH